MASQFENDIDCIQHCSGVNGQNSIVNRCLCRLLVIVIVNAYNLESFKDGRTIIYRFH